MKAVMTSFNEMMSGKTVSKVHLLVFGFCSQFPPICCASREQSLDVYCDRESWLELVFYQNQNRPFQQETKSNVIKHKNVHSSVNGFKLKPDWNQTLFLLESQRGQKLVWCSCWYSHAWTIWFFMKVLVWYQSKLYNIYVYWQRCTCLVTIFFNLIWICTYQSNAQTRHRYIDFWVQIISNNDTFLTRQTCKHDVFGDFCERKWKIITSTNIRLSPWKLQVWLWAATVYFMFITPTWCLATSNQHCPTDLQKSKLLCFYAVHESKVCV